MHVTASKLYNFLQCHHKVWRDIHGPQDEKIEVNDFVKLLWERGVKHESQVVEKMGRFLNLKGLPIEVAAKKTIKAMNNGVELIYQGVLSHGNMRGVPDLLRKINNKEYVPIDIKSGRGYKGGEAESGQLKDHYAVQLCLYVELLQLLGYSKKNFGIIYDIDSKEVPYDLNSKKGYIPFTVYYSNIKEKVQNLIANTKKNDPAIGSKCGLCWWSESCKKWVEKQKDPSLICGLGQKYRDTLKEQLGIKQVSDLLKLDLDAIAREKKARKDFLKGLDKLLYKFVKQAKVLAVDNKPFIDWNRLYKEIKFPKVGHELFFDLESDPLEGIVYLHGIVDRNNNKVTYYSFVANKTGNNIEKETWINFWKYIRSLSSDYVVYHYSTFEKTTYKQLFKKYPDVISSEEMDEFFSKSMDLYYGIVKKYTEWPLSSYSVKKIANYLGFKWRDENPSGAASIQWFNQYIDTGDEKWLDRILKYNEDDCLAMMKIKDFFNNHAT
jgi:uncharacterized protein